MKCFTYVFPGDETPRGARSGVPRLDQGAIEGAVCRVSALFACNRADRSRLGTPVNCPTSPVAGAVAMLREFQLLRIAMRLMCWCGRWQAQDIVPLDPFQHSLARGQHDLPEKRRLECQHAGFNSGHLTLDPVAQHRVDGDLALL